MSDNTNFVITITARDGTKQAFQSLQSSAQQTTTSLQRVGSSSNQSLNQVNTTVTRTGQSFRQLATEAAAVGTAIGATVGIMARLGQLNVQQQREIDALNRLYGESADQLIEFSDQLQQVTIYSDEMARSAIQTAGTLAQNYGFTADQIEQLVTISADLAAVTGTDLDDAAQRVTSAMRGEAESAEMLGLTLNDASVAAFAAREGFEGYSTTMTEAERAQVRFLALQEQAAFATGAAGDQAATAAGQAQQWVNALQDIATQAGAALGPLGSVLSVFGDVALVLPLVGTAAGAAVRGFGSLINIMRTVSIAGVSLSAVLGPAGLVAGLALAAYGIYQWADSAETAAASASQVAEAVEEVGRAFEQAAVSGTNVEYLNRLSMEFQDITTAAQNVQEQINLIQAESAQNQGALFTDERLGPLFDELNRVQFTEEQLASLEQDMAQVISYAFIQMGANAANVSAALEDLNDQFLSGEITAEQYTAGLDDLANNLDTVGIVSRDASGALIINAGAMEDASTASGQLARAQEIASATGEDLIDVLLREAYVAEFNGRTQEAALLRQIARGQEMTDVVNARADAADEAAVSDEAAATAAGTLARAQELATATGSTLEESLITLSEHGYQYADALLAAVQASDELATSFRDAIMPMSTDAFGPIVENLDTFVAAGQLTQEQADAISLAFEGIQLSGASTLEVLVALNEAWYDGGDAVLEFASQLGNAAIGLQRANSLVIDTVDNLGSTIQATADLVGELFDEDPYDGLGPLVDLLNEGRISQEEFNTAVEAGIGILEDNERAQAALREVQADQLPLLEDQTEAYANMLEQLADLPPVEQQRALALQDVAYQENIARLSALAYSAAIGEIPKEAATDIIVSAAQADPILADILESYGLIEVGADGEIRVNFPDGESLVGTVDSLIASIDALTIALGGVPPASDDMAGDLEATGIVIRGVGEDAAAAAAEIEELSAAAANYTPISDYDVYNPGLAPENLPPGTPSAWAYTPAPIVPSGAPGGVALPQPIVESIPEPIIIPATILTTVDQRELEASIREIDGEISIWTGEGYEVYVGADAEDAIRALDEVEGVAYIVDHTTGEVTIVSNTEQFVAETDRVREDTDELDKAVATIDIAGNIEDWLRAADQAEGERRGMDGKQALLSVIGDNGDWMNAAAGAESRRNAIDGSGATISIAGNTQPYYNAVANLPANGAVIRTNYIDIITREYKQSSLGYLGYANGGVVPMPRAQNGLVLVGENGPELAYLPGGTYISPSPSSQEAARRMIPDDRPPIIINLNGPIFGMDDLDRHIADTIALAADQVWLASGVVEGAGV